MNRIRILSEQVANQIAAGEVVERPASVVKEIIENALDAGSKNIDVEIQTGGRKLIRVTDDGLGMSKDDALLALERHATSKIRAAADLQAIRTMGFRGEALPSIASVSRMEITTRERNPDVLAGVRIQMHGGKILQVKEAGAPPGTCVEIRQLFFNVPARRKFMRSEETERAHIQHYLALAALAHPEIAFSFTNNGRTVWRLPAGIAPNQTQTPDKLEALRHRFNLLHGPEMRLLPVDFDESAALSEGTQQPRQHSPYLKLWGLAGAPGTSRGTRDCQYVFVNQRPIENRGLNFALLEAYRTVLMKGRYPVCCLFLEINPAEVDVNIHPSKREVKFHNEYRVRNTVTMAIRETLARFAAAAQPSTPQQEPSAPPSNMGHHTTAITPEREPSTAHGRHEDDQQTSQRPHPEFQTELNYSPSKPTAEPPPPADSDFTTAPTQEQAPEQAQPTLPQRGDPIAPSTDQPTQQTHPPAPEQAPAGITPFALTESLRLVGVIGNLYVVLESPRGLVLLDQHAAHERVLFEQTIEIMDQTDAPSQRLLLPETIELPPRDAQFLRKQLDALNQIGVCISEFGERTFLLDALPPFIQTGNPRQLILDLVDELKITSRAINASRLSENLIAKSVCKHAVKAHDSLAVNEMDHLISQLRHCKMPYTCPHGRPTLIEINYRELEKKFGRIQ
ncbi:MAG: DNA mismatch repair endonuclease MutL [Verrucomicrobia bacterium]|nr:DNA mismatch repair endonuclease MutL [Verrucomicrobiota bacterium]